MFIASATPSFSYPAGSLVRGSIGQTWGAAINAASSVSANIVAPGVAVAYGMVDETTQAAIITQVFRSVVAGIPAGPGLVGSVSWPYVGPIFIYTWGDPGGGSGAFGLTRVDGTAKLAITALTTASITGGV